MVSPSQDLGDVAAGAPAGATLWLAPGTYRLGKGEYDQVIPKKGQTFIGAPGAVLDGQNKNRYAFTGTAANVTVSYLTIQHFGWAGANNNEGVVNHDAGTGWNVSRNTVQDNAGAGVFIGDDNLVSYNCLRHNGQYGFSAYKDAGVHNVTLDHNEIAANDTDDWEAREPGCGCTGGGKFWDTTNADITYNWVHDNPSVGLWADTNNTGFLFQGNIIEGNAGVGLMYETSYNAAIVDNTFSRNGIIEGPQNPGFPTGAIYLSESGSDSRAGSRFGNQFLVSGNTFTNNWSGIVAWENPDRFAGSPANSSTGYTTLVNPSVATLAACSTAAKIKVTPYFDDCRWKVQHLRVQDNTFVMDAGSVSAKCKPSNGCGYNGLFSNYGTYPDWSPYKAYIVPDHISYSQDNLWRNNTYQGPWGFMGHTDGNVLTWQQWRSGPYSQDAGSSMS